MPSHPQGFTQPVPEGTDQIHAPASQADRLNHQADMWKEIRKRLIVQRDMILEDLRHADDTIDDLHEAIVDMSRQSGRNETLYQSSRARFATIAERVTRNEEVERSA